MGRKRVLRLPKTAKFKCIKCEKASRIKVPGPEDSGLYFYECKKCKGRIDTPPSKCCIVCAYTDKKCSAALKREFLAQSR